MLTAALLAQILSSSGLRIYLYRIAFCDPAMLLGQVCACARSKAVKTSRIEVDIKLDLKSMAFFIDIHYPSLSRAVSSS